jgi:GxxExxY protein
VQMTNPVEINNLTKKIIGCCIEVHRELGPGLLESVYEECLGIALSQAGILIERQRELPVHFRGQQLQQSFRFDLLVESVVVVEIKAVDVIKPVHKAQVITYLKLIPAPIGLLCNFNSHHMISGIHRLINPSHAPLFSAK